MIQILLTFGIPSQAATSFAFRVVIVINQTRGTACLLVVHELSPLTLAHRKMGDLKFLMSAAAAVSIGGSLGEVFVSGERKSFPFSPARSLESQARKAKRSSLTNSR